MENARIPPGDVAPRERERQRLGLDGGAALEPGLGEALGNGGGEIEAVEGNVGEVVVLISHRRLVGCRGAGLRPAREMVQNRGILDA